MMIDSAAPPGIPSKANLSSDFSPDNFNENDVFMGYSLANGYVYFLFSERKVLHMLYCDYDGYCCLHQSQDLEADADLCETHRDSEWLLNFLAFILQNDLWTNYLEKKSTKAKSKLMNLLCDLHLLVSLEAIPVKTEVDFNTVMTFVINSECLRSPNDRKRFFYFKR